MHVIAGAADAAAFAPFGTFIDVPAHAGERRSYSEWLSPVRGLSPQFHTNRVAASVLPLTLDRVERHPHAAQAFLPLRVTRYVVTVMASNADGQPDPASARAFPARNYFWPIPQAELDLNSNLKQNPGF